MIFTLTNDKKSYRMQVNSYDQPQIITLSILDKKWDSKNDQRDFLYEPYKTLTSIKLEEKIDSWDWDTINYWFKKLIKLCPIS